MKLQELYEEVIKSKDLQKEFVSCKKSDDVVLFLKKHDCDAKLEEVSTFLQDKFTKEGQVDDKEVEKLSGGCSDQTSDYVFTVSIIGGPVCIYRMLKSDLSKDKSGAPLHNPYDKNQGIFCHDIGA